MANIARPSVQSLLIQMSFNGTPLATGTGFIVKTQHGNPYLVTNRHNVTGRHPQTNAPLSPTLGVPNEIVIVHNKAGALGSWVPTTETLYTDTNQPRWREHPVLGSKADFVALLLTKIDDVEVFPYDLHDAGPKIAVGPADSVSVVGFPFGMTAGGAFAIWATGFMASEMAVDFNDLPVFLIDCRSRQGQSGSPVIAYRGGGMVATEDGNTAIFGGPVQRLLGIYSGRVNAESDLGLVWKVSALVELFASL